MVAMVVLTTKTLYLAVVCQKWPTTSGTIQLAEEVRMVKEGSTRKAKRTLYGTKLRYAFTIGSIEYLGERISFGDPPGRYGSREVVRERLVQYGLGKKVSVHYNPANPKISVLETAITWPNIVFPIVFVLATLLCWTGFRKGWRLYFGRTYGP